MSTDSNTSAQIELAEMMNQYTQLLTTQLRSARDLLTKSVQSIMDDAMKINAAVEKGRAEAEKALENVFVSPDKNAQALVDAVQKNTDQLFELAQAQIHFGKTGEITAPSGDLVEKAAETYQSHINQFNDVERLVTDTLLKMTGSLSSDDVIAHYMRHVATSMHAFEAGLSSILLDFEGRCTSENVSRMRIELHDFNEKQASSLSERATVLKYFPRSA